MKLRKKAVDRVEPVKPVSTVSPWKLLDAAPAIPYIVRMEDAVKFIDTYNRWLRRVESARTSR